MSERKVPPQLTVAQIAQATGWSVKVVRARYKEMGLLKRTLGRLWRVSRRQLMTRDPDVWEDVFAHFEL